MSFNVNRDSNNKTIKKKISYSQTPKITSNRTALSNANSVNLQQLSINNVPITASGSNINSLDTNVGIASSNKAIVLDQNKNITNINTITTNSLTVNNESITGIYQNNNPSNSNSPYIKDIESGLVEYNKLATLDNNLSIKNINDISSNSLTLNKNNINFINNGTEIRTNNILSSIKYTLPFPFNDIFYHSSLNLYVGCYENKIYISSNLFNWTLQYTASAFLVSIAYSVTNNIFVVVGSNIIVTSLNSGITWSEQTAPSILSNSMNKSHNFRSISWSPTLNIFSIVSSSYYYYSPSNVYLFHSVTSSNGINWTYTQQSTSGWGSSSSFEINENKLSWNNDKNRFEYFIGYPSYVTSTNGVNYSGYIVSYLGVSSRIQLWISELGRYYGVYGDYNTNTFASGTSTSLTTIPGSINLTILGWIPTIKKVLAVQSIFGINRLTFSDNFINWEYTSDIKYSLSRFRTDNNMKDLNNNPFFKSGNYLIGLEFNLSNSINLNNLEQISNNLNIPIQSICRSDKLNLFVAISNNNPNKQILTSSNGYTWTLRDTPTNNWTSICWSDNLNLFTAVANSGTNRIMTSSDGITWINNNKNYSSNNQILTKNILSAGNTNSFSILDNNTIRSWGTHFYMGTTNTPSYNYNVTTANSTVLNINNAIAISSGVYHTLALLSNGSINAWGSNSNGQLGNNTTATNNIPTNVLNITNAIKISAGNDHSLALLSDGSIKAWGLNSSGQLGDNTIIQKNSAITVSNINTAIEIAAGETHSLALLSDGTVMNWGNNILIPALVSNLNNVIAISAGGSNNSLALLNDGTIMSWTVGNTPTLINGITNAIDIASGSNFSLALLSDGTVNSWGNNTYGQLGNGSNTTSTTPVNVRILNNIISISASASSTHALALTKQHVLYSWGRNGSGQLGNNTTTNSNSPILVSNINVNKKININSTDLSFITNNWVSITWSPILNLFAAVSNSGNNNRIMISSDGINWISQSSNSNSNWKEIININNCFIAYTDNMSTSNSGKIMYSLDGIKWYNIFSSNSNILWCYIANDILYVAYNNLNNVYIIGYTFTIYENLTVNDTGFIDYSMSINNNYKLKYINKTNQYILISNNSNKIYIAYDKPFIFTEYILPSTLNWSDICWSDNLNYFIITNINNNLIIKPDSLLINNLNKVNNNIVKNKFNNSINNIIPKISYSSTTTFKNIFWNDEINDYIPITNLGFAYSPLLKIGIFGYNSSSYVSPNVSYGVQTAELDKINKTFINFVSRIVPTGTTSTWNNSYNDVGSWNVNYWCSEWKTFYMGNTMVNYSYNNVRIVKSIDGINWSTCYTSDTVAVRKFEWVDKYKILIVYLSTGYMYTNNNGVSWNSFTNSPGSITYGCYSNPLNLLITVQGQEIKYGTFINTLTSISLSSILSSNNLLYVEWFDKLNIFIALTNTSKIFISSNGINWKVYNIPGTFSYVTWINKLNSLIFLTSDASNTPIYICNLYTNNINLSYFNSNTITNYKNNSVNNWYLKSTPSNTWKSIVYSIDLNLFVAVANSGNNDRIMTSNDGWNWTSRTIPVDNDWTSICYSSDLELLVAVSNTGTNNRVMTSNDGIIWTSRTSAANNNWTSICYSSELNLFVAVSNSGINNRVMTSNNGINWTTRASASDNNWTSVCWSEIGLFVAVSNSGANNRVMTSADGIIWTSRVSANNNDWTSVCWASSLGLFIAVSNSGTNNRIMTSIDGITWTSRTSPVDNNWTSIIYVDDLNLVVAIANSGTDRIMKSNDGINWITMPIDNKDWQSICWAKELGIFAAVSSSNSNSDILISNIAIIGIHNNISQLDSLIAGTQNGSNKALRLGGSNSNNQVLNLNSNSNNELLRLTYNNSNTNYTNMDLNSTGSQLNIEVNGSNKIFNIVNHNSINTGLKFQNNLLIATANDLNKLDSEFGIASNSKILSVNNTKNINNINNLGINKVFINNSLLLTNNDNNNNYIQNITPGISEASKCIIPDSNLNINNLNTLNSKIININKTNIVNEPSLIDYQFNKNLNSGSLLKKYPSNINVYSICWSPTLSLFIAVGDCWNNGNGSFYKIMSSSDGINWEPRYIFYTGTMYSICWSSELSLFVAVGTLGRIVTSIDGINWITRSNPLGSSITMTSIAWSNTLNLFVSITNSGTYRIITSPDGITWTTQTSFTTASNWNSVIWASGLSLFVAVANSGTTTTQVVTSNNGTTWALRTSPVANTWTSVTYSSTLNLLVAVSNSGTNNRIMTSSDGTTWTSRTSPADNNWTSVVWASGLGSFIAVSNNGTNNRIMKSSNGTTWSLVDTTNLNIDYNVIAYSSNLNLIVAGGLSSGSYSNNKIVTSIDSNTWILRDTNYDGWNKILWIPSLNSYIGCASSSGFMKRIIKSSNGIDWTLFSTNIITDFNNYLIQDMIYVSELNLFLAIGNTFILRSSNAETWINCTLPTGTLNLRSIVWASSLNLLVAVGNSGTMSSRILTSPDGINWTSQTHPLLTANWYSITWSSSLNLFAIASITNYYNQVITSPDGINWTLRTTSTNAFVINSINWIPQLNLFIATGTNSYIIKSSDGINWTQSIIYANDGTGLSSIINQLVWINKYNILVGISTNNGNSQNILVYTYDTITWYTITLPYFNNNSYSSVVYSNELEQFIVYTNSSSNSFAPFITYNLNSIIQNTSSSINLNNVSTLIKPDNTMINNAINNWNSIVYNYNNNLTCICYSSYLKRYVALSNTGTSNRVIYSTNGISWTTTSSAVDNNWTSICWSFKLKLFVAVANSGTNNRIITSLDGTSWISRTSPADNNWASVCWSNELNLFIAVANSGTNNRFMISSNGIDWGTILVNNNNNWNSICWSPELSLFVAVSSTGTNNRIITSSNGFDWTTRTNPVDNNWTSVCWAPELSLFVAVSNTGTGDRIMTSSDGITWTSRTNPVDNNWTSVCWAPEIMCFIAVSNSGTNNRIMKSLDGINWSVNSINYNLIYNPILTLNTIAGGNNHTLILLNSNTVSVIGSNSNGQLCESTTTSSRTTPNIISSNLYNVIEVTAGNNHSLVLLSNGTIQGFGRNDYGQLGDSSTTQRTSQVTVSGINNAIDISTGPSGNHSLALLNDNTVKAWGTNFYGQLGNTVNIGTNTANSTPSLISNLSNVIMVKAGNNHSLALLNNGTIMAWGFNDRGQLGDGTTNNSSSPVTVSGINNAIAIAAGDKHSVALLSDGTIKTWGSNEFNQLGNSTNAGTTTANSTALSVLNITNAIAIASGSNHCLALLNDNTVRAWGRNADGQLGNNTTVNNFTPVTVTSVSNAIGIAAGDVHSLALINNGIIRAWGDNQFGKLGDSSTTDRNTPITVSSINNAKYNETGNNNYSNNDWTSICWNPDLEIFAVVSNSGTNNRIMISSNDSILSRETVIKNLNNSFNIDQSNDRIGLNIANPSYQLHLSSSSVAKPGTSTWTVSSDIRLKEDIENADLNICYNNIKNLSLKKYKWKDEYITTENDPDRHKLGWIAQEVELILPKSVKTIEQYGLNDCKTINTDQIIAHMHGCVKKLLNIYENQNNKINNLNQDITEMKTFINNL